MRSSSEADIVLIGAGIMSATLGALLKTLDPALTIAIFERLDVSAAESSDAWNNAGTGHSAFCELNYTPARPDGTVEITKPIGIAEAFEVSKQLWATLVERGVIRDPRHFISRIPHMSFVIGAENIAYLRARYAAMRTSPLFASMVYSEDPAQLRAWMPLVMGGRDGGEPVAATRVEIGTDVNFGALTRDLFGYLQGRPGVTTSFHHDVGDLTRDGDGRWRVEVTDRDSHETREVLAKFVFIGAGGGSLPLLLRSGIPESKGYGGFPVGGQWLVCKRPDVIARHHAKVYGRAAVGAPPMSVPHLDTRVIEGERALLFGPFAGFSTKFLKHGSLLDLPLSLRLTNVLPMLSAGLDNLALTKYLIEQVAQSPDDRLEALREFVPTAELDEWKLETAGQRVQVIKHDDEHGGVLEFGTEVVSAADGSIAALLGASPGASTAASIMIGLIERCFPARARTAAWQDGLRALVPSYGQSLHRNAALLAAVRARTDADLGLGA